VKALNISGLMMGLDNSWYDWESKEKTEFRFASGF